jgi:3-demethoxyubiquinol 3-hydroxylase
MGPATSSDTAPNAPGRSPAPRAPQPAAVAQGAPARADDTLTVLYDGACPLCRREIGLYQGLAAAQPACALQFADVSDAATGLPPGSQRDALLARFHVQHADGRLSSGARAFTALWARLPGWRWLAVLARVPGVTPLMEVSYRGFLRLRPLMQRTARAFEPPALHVPAALVGELRSDHAGETGAVWIYRGVLAVTRDGGVRQFAQQHLATEQEHLRLITPLVPWPRRSRLLLPWRLAGWLTGALPALAGPRAVYATVAAVETFVDTHYQQQIDSIDALPDAQREAAGPLRALLERCRQDECHHRDEAAAAEVLQQRPAGGLLRAWCALVGWGSAAAVVMARRI